MKLLFQAGTLALAFGMSSGAFAQEPDTNVRCVVEGTSASGRPILTDVASETLPHARSTYTAPVLSGDFTFATGRYVDGSNEDSPSIVLGTRSGFSFGDPDAPQVPDGARFYIQVYGSPAAFDDARPGQQRRIRRTAYSRRSFFVPYADIQENGFRKRIRLLEISNGSLVRTRATLTCNTI